MDVGELTGLFAVLIAFLPVAVGSVWAFGKTDLGRALVIRIRGTGGLDEPEIEHLRQAVTGLQMEMTELHERLEFTERLLAGQREPERLPGR
jgi:hypothetical protein